MDGAVVVVGDLGRCGRGGVAVRGRRSKQNSHFLYITIRSAQLLELANANKPKINRGMCYGIFPSTKAAPDW